MSMIVYSLLSSHFVIAQKIWSEMGVRRNFLSDMGMARTWILMRSVSYFAENPPNFQSITLKETSIVRFFKVAECQSTAKLIYKGNCYEDLLDCSLKCRIQMTSHTFWNSLSYHILCGLFSHCLALRHTGSKFWPMHHLLGDRSG